MSKLQKLDASIETLTNLRHLNKFIFTGAIAILLATSAALISGLCSLEWGIFLTVCLWAECLGLLLLYLSIQQITGIAGTLFGVSLSETATGKEQGLIYVLHEKVETLADYFGPFGNLDPRFIEGMIVLFLVIIFLHCVIIYIIKGGEMKKGTKE